jgi:type I restriction enzyme M protein
MAMQSGFIKRIRDIMRMDAGINGDAQRIEQMVWMLFLKVYDAKEDDWELSDDGYTSIIPEECRWRNWAHKDEDGHALTGDKLLDFVNNTLFPTLKELPVTPKTPVKKAIVKSTFEDANNYMKDGVYLRQVVDVIDEIEFDDVKESHAFGFVYEEILRELQSAGSSGEFYTPRAVTEFMAMMVKPKLGEKMADFACGTGGFITSWLSQLEKQVKETADRKALDDSIYGVEKKPFPYLLCVTNMLLHDIEVPNIYHMNSLRHNLLDYTDDDKFDVILMNPPYGGHEDKSIQGFFPDDLASSETADLFMSVIMYRLKKNGRAAVVVPDGFLFGLDNAKVAIKKKLLTEFNLHTIVRLPGSVFSPYTSISTNLLFFDNTEPTKETWYYRVDIPSDRKHFSKTKPMELKHFDECIAWWNDRKEITAEDGVKACAYSAEFLINEQGCNLDLCGYPHEEEEVLDPLDTIREYQEKANSIMIKINSLTDAVVQVLQCESVLEINHNLSQECGQLAKLSDEFAGTLKKSILQYAIQGKLVEQRLEEGTAEELYQQIQAEKQKLIKDGKIKKEKPLPEIKEDEIPFDIPENWKWVRWGDLSYSIQYGYNAPAQTQGRIKMVRISDIQDGKIVWDTVPYCEIAENDIETYILKKNDILFARTGGTVGKSFLVGDICEEAIYAGYLIRTRYSENLLSPFYLKYFMGTQLYWNQLRNGTIATAQPNCNGKTLSKMLIPLPPLAEQHRIVAKIEELLPYCDRLVEK